MSADIELTDDDMLSDNLMAPGNVYVEWQWWGDKGITIEVERSVAHARGRRQVEARFNLDRLLDSLAATKVGRRAILDALVRHET